MHRLQRTHKAMATEFGAILVGDDREHLDAVCTLIFEEIDRVERLLSRFDPASEVFRVNRGAAARPVKLSVELAEIIADCRQWHARTQGAFDITINSPDYRDGANWRAVQFDAGTRILRFQQESLCFDFGGYGKGYALDRVAELFQRHGVKNGFVHGGTSSILARGMDIDKQAWQIDLPSGDSMPLIDTFVSTSQWPYDAGRLYGDFWRDQSGCLVNHQARACTVLATAGADAEALSTALVCTGFARSKEYCHGHFGFSTMAAWFDHRGGYWISPRVGPDLRTTH
jgi:thiamine biosynthesis lipoprotein